MSNSTNAISDTGNKLVKANNSTKNIRFEPKSKNTGAYLKKASAGTTALLVAIGLLSVPAQASEVSPERVNLRSIATYSILSNGAVTNSGASSINGDLGTSVASSIVDRGTLAIGGSRRTGAAVEAARTDAALAWQEANGRKATGFFPKAGGGTYTAGVYFQGEATTPVGTVTLDAQGNPDAVFIFNIGGALTAGANSNVVLTNGAQSKNVFWAVLGAFTLGANSGFAGTVIATGAATLGANASIQGRIVSNSIILSGNTITTQIEAAPPVVVAPPATVKKSVEVLTNFSTNSTKLNAKAAKSLRALVKSIPKGATNIVVEATGGLPDNPGKSRSNLANARAASTNKFLRSAGLKGVYRVVENPFGLISSGASNFVLITVTYDLKPKS